MTNSAENPNQRKTLFSTNQRRYALLAIIAILTIATLWTVQTIRASLLFNNAKTAAAIEKLESINIAKSALEKITSSYWYTPFNSKAKTLLEEVTKDQKALSSISTADQSVSQGDLDSGIKSYIEAINYGVLSKDLSSSIENKTGNALTTITHAKCSEITNQIQTSSFDTAIYTYISVTKTFQETRQYVVDSIGADIDKNLTTIKDKLLTSVISTGNDQKLHQSYADALKTFEQAKLIDANQTVLEQIRDINYLINMSQGDGFLKNKDFSLAKESYNKALDFVGIGTHTGEVVNNAIKNLDVIQTNYNKQQEDIRQNILTNYDITDNDWNIIKPIIDKDISPICGQGLMIKVTEFKAGIVKGKKWASFELVPSYIKTDVVRYNFMSNEYGQNWSLIDYSELPNAFKNYDKYFTNSKFQFSVTGAPDLGKADNVDINDFKTVALRDLEKSPYNYYKVSVTGIISFIEDLPGTGKIVIQDNQGSMVYVQTIGVDLPFYKGDHVRVYGIVTGQSNGDITLNGQPIVLTKVIGTKVERY